MLAIIVRRTITFNEIIQRVKVQLPFQKQRQVTHDCLLATRYHRHIKKDVVFYIKYNEKIKKTGEHGTLFCILSVLTFPLVM